jgi:hypothetical protein
MINSYGSLGYAEDSVGSKSPLRLSLVHSPYNLEGYMSISDNLEAEDLEVQEVQEVQEAQEALEDTVDMQDVWQCQCHPQHIGGPR